MFDTQLTRLSLLLLISVSTPCSARVTKSWDEEGVGKGCIVSDLNDLSSNEIKNLISESSSLRLHIPNHEPDIKDVKKLLGKEYKVTTEEDSFGCYNGAVYIVTKDGPGAPSPEDPPLIVPSSGVASSEVDSSEVFSSEDTSPKDPSPGGKDLVGDDESPFRLYKGKTPFIGYTVKNEAQLKNVRSFHVNGNAGNVMGTIAGRGLNEAWKNILTKKFDQAFLTDINAKQSALLGDLKEDGVVTRKFEAEKNKATRSYKVLYGCGRNNKEAEKYVGGSVMLGIFHDDRRMGSSIGHLYMTGTSDENFYLHSLRIVGDCVWRVIAEYNKSAYKDKIKYALIPFINGGLFSIGSPDVTSKRPMMADRFVQKLMATQNKARGARYILSQDLTNTYLQTNKGIKSEPIQLDD